MYSEIFRNPKYNIPWNINWFKKLGNLHWETRSRKSHINFPPVYWYCVLAATLTLQRNYCPEFYQQTHVLSILIDFCFLFYNMLYNLRDQMWTHLFKFWSSYSVLNKEINFYLRWWIFYSNFFIICPSINSFDDGNLGSFLFGTMTNDWVNILG